MELESLCLVEHGIGQQGQQALQFIPLDETHIPPGPGGEASVSLVSIGNLQGVNRLPSDQKISFGESPGLAIIYGDNGSGKSGYARVIKKACRTRGAAPVIIHNVLETPPGSPASAELNCDVSGLEYPARWEDGVIPDAVLANIFVFDATTAGYYLTEDDSAAFTPRWLDVLKKLSTACDSLGASLQEHITTVEKKIALTAAGWKCPQQTDVSKLLASLSATTDASSINALAGLSDDQEQRLKDLAEALKSDPKKKAQETRASAKRVQAFVKALSTAALHLSDDSIKALGILVEDACTKAKAAELFSQGQFDTSYLPGTGGDLWRALWEAARRYSLQSAYKDSPFPMTEENARCLLCQRELDTEAVTRLNRFDEFFRNESQRLADEASRLLKEGAAVFDTICDLTVEVTNVEADLAGTSDELRAATRQFVAAAVSRLKSVKDYLAGGAWNDPGTLTQSPVDNLTKYAASLEARAVMEDSADDPRARAQLQSEYNELRAREWLGEKRDEILTQLKRYRSIVALRQCLTETNTSAITSKNTQLTKQLVTDTFCHRFEDEIKALGLSTINVSMEPTGGKKGSMRFGPRIASAKSHAIKDVASEGEQRCITLAVFLAELSQASHNSALVFDDPASSLDHWHRDKIAMRLVKESAIRQVIVFTHDAILLNDLEAAAKEAKVTPTLRFLEWCGDSPGVCCEGLPWDCKSPEDRLDRLEKKQRDLVNKWGPRPSEAVCIEMYQAYSWLRATVERIVEKLIFADVVFRFRKYVNLKDLDRVIGFTEAECLEVKRIFKRCCDITDAHDKPQPIRSSPPTPAELDQDIKATRQLVDNIRVRQKAASSTP